jgi:hypothetical protein
MILVDPDREEVEAWVGLRGFVPKRFAYSSSKEQLPMSLRPQISTSYEAEISAAESYHTKDMTLPFRRAFRTTNTMGTEEKAV